MQVGIFNDNDRCSKVCVKAIIYNGKFILNFQIFTMQRSNINLKNSSLAKKNIQGYVRK